MKRFRLRQAAAAVLAAGALLTGAAAPVRAEPPIWRVRGAHAEVTLFGSVHILSPSTRWRTPALQGDLARADQLWFEIPIDPATQAQAVAGAVQLGLLPPGQTLQGLLPATAWARVQALAQSEGVQPASLQRMRPWLAELTLSTFYFQRHGADAKLGVEAQISSAARPGVERDAFETVSEQLHLFADDPLADQIASLAQTLDEITDDPGLFDRVVAEWARGDTRALVQDVIVPARRDTPGDYQRLLVARNRRFAARVEQMLKGSRRAVVVVGVGHLIGPDGVPALLRGDGIAVDGP